MEIFSSVSITWQLFIKTDIPDCFCFLAGGWLAPEFFRGRRLVAGVPEVPEVPEVLEVPDFVEGSRLRFRVSGLGFGVVFFLEEDSNS
jgi:hypothetical protein